MDTDTIRESFREGGDDFDYRDSNVDLGAVASGETSIHIDHFVVRRDARGEGLASQVLTALEDVMREEGYYSLTVKMQATECKTLEELESYTDEHDHPDPTEIFLTRRGFRGINPIEDWQWNLCFKAQKML